MLCILLVFFFNSVWLRNVVVNNRTDNVIDNKDKSAYVYDAVEVLQPSSILKLLQPGLSSAAAIIKTSPRRLVVADTRGDYFQ